MPFAVIASVGAIAHYAKLPFIFPSLGPTAFLQFAKPAAPPSSPKNTILGHFLGILAGAFGLWVTGMYSHENVLVEGVLPLRIICAALAVAITCVGMIIFNIGHPPAGATTLIVSLGLIRTPITWCVMMASVTILTVEAWIANKILRRDVVFPYWRHGSWIDNWVKAKKVAQAEESLETKLSNEMRRLSTDNFAKCFDLCSKAKNDAEMQKLLQFLSENKSLLSNDAIPFAVRVVMSSNSATIQV